MRTHVEFRSDKFPAYEAEKEQVTNPDLWGKRLAEYLARELLRAGFQTKEMYAENWGWIIPIVHDSFLMWIGCGHYQEHWDGYLVFIKPGKPSIPKLLKKVADTLDQILTADYEIRDIRWWS